jgi:hypothetical protein
MLEAPLLRLLVRGALRANAWIYLLAGPHTSLKYEESKS